MAWNRSSEQKSIAKKSPPKISRGFVAGLVVVLIALGAVVYLTRSNDEGPKERAERKPTRIKETTPAAAPKYKEEPKPAKKPEPEKPKTAPWRNKSLTEEQREVAYEKHLAETPLPKASTNRLFRTGLEQVMGWVFTTEVGDMPPPLPLISDMNFVHLQEILDSKNEVKDTDSDESAETKRIVDNVKQELKKYIEKGGDPQEFLAYYHDTLKSAYQERKMAQDEVIKVLRTEPELADDYLKKVNESLAERGIKGVIIPERIRLRVEAEMNQLK